MTLARLRGVVIVLAVCGIAGMISSTIATDNNNGWVMSFGFLAALGAIPLLVASLVRPAVTPDQEVLAAGIEAKVAQLVAHGAPEPEIRSLLGDAVAFGRSRSTS